MCFKTISVLGWVNFVTGFDAGIPDHAVPAFGECVGGTLPTRCRVRHLKHFNWKLYLNVLCSEVPRSVARDAILQALAHFDAESARSCPEGFAVTMLALSASGAVEFDDQIISFKPDGSANFLVLAWDLQTGKPVLDHWSTSLPPQLALPPPWPALWKYPGPLGRIRQAQDLSSLIELDASSCDERALKMLGACTEKLLLLRLLCSSCDRSGLPCLFGQNLMSYITSELKELQSRASPPKCGHAVLAALLAMNGKSGAVAPETDSQVYRQHSTGRLILHSKLSRVAGDADNLFALNIPMMNLAPFPFHTAMLRSARGSVQSPDYYQEALMLVSRSLERRGIWHILVPGDFSAGKQQSLSRQSIMLSVSFYTQNLTFLEEELGHRLHGIWRLVHVSPGLLQIGEEPFRFSPRSGVHFRTFCNSCVYFSLYFYVWEEEYIFPLAPWVPCRIPSRRVFPPRHDVLPLAADSLWIRFTQRAALPPQSDCVLQRRRLTKDVAVAEELSFQQWPSDLDPAFDISDGLHDNMGLYDLMRRREDSEEPGLHRFSDKIQFKSWMMKESFPIAKIYHMSSTSPEVLTVLHNLSLSRFVAKPTHLAATSYVYAMKNGINIVNGNRVSLHEIEMGLKEAWNDRHLDDWATESTTPGIIVEELVEAESRAFGAPDELKCQTFWGTLFFCEWTFVQNMTSGTTGSARFEDANQQGDRAQAAMGHKACGIPNFASRGYIFRDGSCMDCTEALPLTAQVWRQLVQTVEKIAKGTDHIRIDLFVAGGNILVNEANISFLKISKFPAELIEEMRRRWLEGYHFWHPKQAEADQVSVLYLGLAWRFQSSIMQNPLKDVVRRSPFQVRGQHMPQLPEWLLSTSDLGTCGHGIDFVAGVHLRHGTGR
ncbi:unnamed protein product [Durusdinium trenchii]|uniref:Uncharacterized protein n=2 Tax=Durusdinium trenchii TaxID=1381693 RepID=A0ABP0J2C3_9DINO